jgi:hypothetical protein
MASLRVSSAGRISKASDLAFWMGEEFGGTGEQFREQHDCNSGIHAVGASARGIVPRLLCVLGQCRVRTEKRGKYVYRGL